MYDDTVRQDVVADFAMGMSKAAIARKRKLNPATVRKILDENSESLKAEIERVQALKQDIRDGFIEQMEGQWMTASQKSMELLIKEIDSLVRGTKKETEVSEEFDATGKLVKRVKKTRSIRNFDRVLALFKEIQKPFLAMDKAGYDAAANAPHAPQPPTSGAEDDLSEFDE